MSKNPFLKEKDLFFILFAINSSKDSLCFSDKKNYLIGRSSENLPTWIWTKDSPEEKSLEEMVKILNENYFSSSEIAITSKKELYDFLKNVFPTRDYFEMGFLSCKKLNNIDLSPGFMDYPSRVDKDVLATYWINNGKELYPSRIISKEESLQEVEGWIDNDDFFVWRNPKGKIVCMAGLWVESNLAKISHVYTPPEERKKGYCASLIYSVTKLLLEKGYEPMLYTDYHYEASNKAYQKVGYENQGLLINYKIKKKNI